MNPLFRSLTLTWIFSFFFPLLIVGILFSGLLLIGALPWVALLGQIGQTQLINFLVIFGGGSILPGLLTIAATCSFVAVAFDLFNFWLYQTVKE